ncbi:MAG: DUF1800 domain-containing protein [Bacteroidota bacterium]
MNRRSLFTLKKDIQDQHRIPLTQQGNPEHLQRTTAGLEQYTPTSLEPWNYERAAHVLRRASIAPKNSQILDAVSKGFESTIDMIFKPFSVDISEISPWCDEDPQIKPIAPKTLQDILDERIQRREIIGRWYLKVIGTSKISIQERMVSFWHNHFVSEFDVVDTPQWMYIQNQLFRKNCLGNFRTFVQDVTIDPAMLIYLDGYKNKKIGNNKQINENYARELMELFTCGVLDWNNNPNYTENDVLEAARSLSGWTFSPSTHPDAIERASRVGRSGLFLQSNWDSGSKTFMGKTGNWRYTDIISILFSERSDQIALNICEKIYRAFVYDTPDRVIIRALADEFKKNWEIKPMLMRLLKSAHFFDKVNIGAMYKSPIDYILGSLHMMNITHIPDFALKEMSRFNRDVSNRLTSLGQSIFNPPNVKGWPGGRTWVSTSTISQRHKLMIDIINGTISFNKIKYYDFDPIVFAKSFPDPTNPRTLCTDICNAMLNTAPSEKEYQMLLDTMLDGAKEYEWTIDDPKFQADKRLKKFLIEVAKLAKYQLY